MKNVLLTIIALVSFSSFSQSVKSIKVLQKMIVNQSSDYDTTQPITFRSDGSWMFIEDFKMIFEYYDFDIITEEKAKEISSSNSKEFNSVYEFIIQGNTRLDIGICGGEVPSAIYVKVVDLKNKDKLVATFSFSQGIFDGKCTRNVAEAVVLKLKEISQTK